MAASADSSASSKVLAINHSFFDISFFFCPFIIMGIMGVIFRKSIILKMFLLFAITYQKINMNVIKTISPRQQFADAY